VAALKRRDGWDQPADTGDDDAFLMVQVMETWFLADRDALRSYFGSKFLTSALGEWPELESVPKATVLKALDKATSKCKTNYTKGAVSFQLLAVVDPAKVELQCPHAGEFLARLRTM
jgi:Domain of unknown function (DUF4276)